MTTVSKLGSAILCASALLQFGAAHAVVTYEGVVFADNFDPYNRIQDSSFATTITPATYAANASGNTATSTTDDAKGGSVYSASNSVGAYSILCGCMFGGLGTANTTLSYRVMLVGPISPVVIPVHVIANGFVNGTGATQASATFVVNYDSGGAGAQLLASVSVRGTGSDSFAFDQVVNFKTNAFFDVYLSAGSLSGGSGSPAGLSEAFVDPSFTIDDPRYASLYHFEGIPGVMPSVPEPASWMLLLLGAAAICGRRRRAGMTV